MVLHRAYSALQRQLIHILEFGIITIGTCFPLFLPLICIRLGAHILSFTFLDHHFRCDCPWNDPPEYCDVYPGQKSGRFDNTKAVANMAGRTDVEGCW